MSKLRSEHVLEKTRKAAEEILGCRLEDADIPSLEKASKVVSKIKEIELDGVYKYSEQFVKFIAGCKLGELPYILAGMRMTIRALYNSIPAEEQIVREKYRKMNELVKTSVRTTVGYTERSEDGDDA